MDSRRGSRQNLAGPPAIMSAVDTDGSSPLSEARSEHELDNLETLRQIEQVTDQNVKDEGGQEKSRSTSPLSSPQPTPAPADESAGSDVENPVNACPYCDKTYASGKSLKRHLGDRKNKCYKDRQDVEEGSASKWSCPRCKASLPKKFAIECHIEKACWKICDECVESNSKECDASYREGDCTACVLARKTCTKHDKPFEDCTPELLTDAPAAPPNNPMDRIHQVAKVEGKQQRLQRKKRQARESPEMSPRSMPKAKRKSRARKTGDEAGRQVLDEVPDESQPEMPLGLEIKPGQFLRHRLPVPSIVPSQAPQGHQKPIGRSLLPAFQPKAGRHGTEVHQSQHQQYTAQERNLGHTSVAPYVPSMLPPTSNTTGTHPGPEPYRSTEEMLERQKQALRDLEMASRYQSQYVPVYQQSAPTSSMRSSIHLGQNGWPQNQQQNFPFGQAHIRASIPTSSHIQQNYPLNGSNEGDHFGFSAPGPQVPSRRFSTANFQPTTSSYPMSSRPGCSTSRASSRQPSMADFEHSRGNDFMLPHQSAYASRRSSVADDHASAPGSRMQSLQPSHQSSHKQLAPRPGNAHETGATPSLVVKLPMPRELKMQLTLDAPPDDSERDLHSLRLRIHSNTRDANNNPIFSILNIRPNEPFGPRFDYYCQVRGKRYTHDYKFIFKYPAPCPANPNRKRYFDISWDTTPSQLRDPEYPGSRLQEGDTIYVVNRRTPVGGDADELGTQLDVQRILIQDGETRVFQDPRTMDAWYMNADATIAGAQGEIAALKNQLAAQTHNLSTRTHQLQALAARNVQLQNEIAQLRRAMAPPAGYAQSMMAPQHLLPSQAMHPDMLQHRARQIAAQRPQVPFMDQAAGHQALYATAGLGMQTQARPPPIGTFAAPELRDRGGVRHYGSAREPVDEDAEGEYDDEE